MDITHQNFTLVFKTESRRCIVPACSILDLNSDLNYFDGMESGFLSIGGKNEHKNV
jgi:hypothetical protein